MPRSRHSGYREYRQYSNDSGKNGSGSYRPDWKNPLVWVKDLGGWAVVCFIVYWLTTKWEEIMKDQITELKLLSMSINSSQTAIITSIDNAMNRSSIERAKILAEIESLKQEMLAESKK